MLGPIDFYYLDETSGSIVFFLINFLPVFGAIYSFIKYLLMMKCPKRTALGAVSGILFLVSLAVIVFVDLPNIGWLIPIFIGVVCGFFGAVILGLIRAERSAEKTGARYLAKNKTIDAIVKRIRSERPACFIIDAQGVSIGFDRIAFSDSGFEDMDVETTKAFATLIKESIPGYSFEMKEHKHTEWRNTYEPGGSTGYAIPNGTGYTIIEGSGGGSGPEPVEIVDSVTYTFTRDDLSSNKTENEPQLKSW